MIFEKFSFNNLFPGSEKKRAQETNSGEGSLVPFDVSEIVSTAPSQAKENVDSYFRLVVSKAAESKNSSDLQEKIVNAFSLLLKRYDEVADSNPEQVNSILLFVDRMPRSLFSEDIAKNMIDELAKHDKTVQLLLLEKILFKYEPRPETVLRQINRILNIENSSSSEQITNNFSNLEDSAQKIAQRIISKYSLHAVQNNLNSILLSKATNKIPNVDLNLNRITDLLWKNSDQLSLANKEKVFDYIENALSSDDIPKETKIEYVFLLLEYVNESSNVEALVNKFIERYFDTEFSQSERLRLIENSIDNTKIVIQDSQRLKLLSELTIDSSNIWFLWHTLEKNTNKTEVAQVCFNLLKESKLNESVFINVLSQVPSMSEDVEQYLFLNEELLFSYLENGIKQSQAAETSNQELLLHIFEKIITDQSKVLNLQTFVERTNSDESIVQWIISALNNHESKFFHSKESFKQLLQLYEILFHDRPGDLEEKLLKMSQDHLKSSSVGFTLVKEVITFYKNKNFSNIELYTFFIDFYLAKSFNEEVYNLILDEDSPLAISKSDIDLLNLVYSLQISNNIAKVGQLEFFRNLKRRNSAKISPALIDVFLTDKVNDFVDDAESLNLFISFYQYEPEVLKKIFTSCKSKPDAIKSFTHFLFESRSNMLSVFLDSLTQEEISILFDTFDSEQEIVLLNQKFGKITAVAEILLPKILEFFANNDSNNEDFLALLNSLLEKSDQLNFSKRLMLFDEPQLGRILSKLLAILNSSRGRRYSRLKELLISKSLQDLYFQLSIKDATFKETITQSKIYPQLNELKGKISIYQKIENALLFSRGETTKKPNISDHELEVILSTEDLADDIETLLLAIVETQNFEAYSRKNILGVLNAISNKEVLATALKKRLNAISLLDDALYGKILFIIEKAAISSLSLADLVNLDVSKMSPDVVLKLLYRLSILSGVDKALLEKYYNTLISNPQLTATQILDIFDKATLNGINITLNELPTISSEELKKLSRLDLQRYLKNFKELESADSKELFNLLKSWLDNQEVLDDSDIGIISELVIELGISFSDVLASVNFAKPNVRNLIGLVIYNFLSETVDVTSLDQNAKSFILRFLEDKKDDLALMSKVFKPALFELLQNGSDALIHTVMSEYLKNKVNVDEIITDESFIKLIYRYVSTLLETDGLKDAVRVLQILSASNVVDDNLLFRIEDLLLNKLSDSKSLQELVSTYSLNNAETIYRLLKKAKDSEKINLAQLAEVFSSFTFDVTSSNSLIQYRDDIAAEVITTLINENDAASFFNKTQLEKFLPIILSLFENRFSELGKNIDLTSREFRFLEKTIAFYQEKQAEYSELVNLLLIKILQSSDPETALDKALEILEKENFISGENISQLLVNEIKNFLSDNSKNLESFDKKSNFGAKLSMLISYLPVNNEQTQTIVQFFLDNISGKKSIQRNETVYAPLISKFGQLLTVNVPFNVNNFDILKFAFNESELSKLDFMFVLNIDENESRFAIAVFENLVRIFSRPDFEFSKISDDQIVILEEVVEKFARTQEVADSEAYLNFSDLFNLVSSQE